MKLSMQFFIRFLFLLTICTAGVLATASNVKANQLKGVRAWPSPDNTRVVLDLTKKPSYKIHYLKEPDRLLVDLKSTTSHVDLGKIINDGPLVKKLRVSGSEEKGTYRIAIDLSKASKAKVFLLPPEKPYGYRLVLDLPHQSLERKVPVNPIIKKEPVFVPIGRDITIAIDAGHGGEDPGAIGRYTYEKNVTLELAKRLQKRINRQEGMQAFLIRTGDYFVNLNKRSAIARKKKADFLVSIHADGFTSSRPRGASVWVLSNRRATTELGRWMEKHEAHSELLGGAGELIQDSSSVPFLTEMFLDMSMGNSMDVGYHVGDLVVKELGKVTQMHRKKPVHASLAVLKSPDIPSILVEAGFITNRTEEKLLNQSSHQNKIANAVFTGIYKHFVEAPPQDTLFAQKKRIIKHTVRSGESISRIAAKYSVASKELMSYNKLRSTSLRIGQIIKIPPDYQLFIKEELGSPKVVTQKAVTHKVKRGESLSLIAQQYGKTTTELKNYNKLRSTVLAVGQKIKVPGQKEPAIQVAKTESRPQKLQVIVHKVKRGESLSVIASRYGKTSSELKAYNKLRSTELAIGQKIKVPDQKVPVVQVAKTKSHPQPLQVVVHQVKRGESLSVIASRYGKTSSELKAYNKLRSTELAIGQKIKVPGQKVPAVQIAETKSPSQPLKEIVHKVKSGESLSVIASRYGKSTRELKVYNKLRSTSVQVGQKLKIPGQKVPSVQVAKTESRPQPLKEIVHKVKNGESLSVIASRYGKSTSELKAYNKLRSTSVQVGQKLKIPGANYTKPTVAAITKPITHKVKSGDSLSVLASRFGTTSAKLKSYNKLKSSTLYVGQIIKIPSSLVQLKKHKVRSGESLSVIASRYGVTMNAIKAFNKLRSTSLFIGQVLTVPLT